MKAWIALALVSLLVVCAPVARASMREIKPGEVPVLAPDEGLLVIGVDSSAPIGTLHIARQGSLVGGESIKDLPQGKSRRLFIVTAGEYRWDRIQYFEWRVTLFFDLKDDPEYRFLVKPGVINYPGDLVYRPSGTAVALIHASNRGLGAIDWLEATHPAVYAKSPFVYTGHSSDPFPAFYRGVREAHPAVADADLDKTLPAPDPGKLPIAVEDLWKQSPVQSTTLNPSGNLLAEAVAADDGWSVDLVDLDDGSTTRLLKGPKGISRMDWAGPQVLAVTLVARSGQAVYIVRIGDKGAKGRSHVDFMVPKAGFVLDPLPDDPDHLLYESRADNGVALVHKIDISGPSAFDHQQFTNAARIDRGVSLALGWLTDGSGRLRGALAMKGEDSWLYWGADGAYEPILKVGPRTEFLPIMLSADGNAFYGLSDKGRSQRDLVAFDPRTRSITRTIFSKPGSDIVDVVFDAHHRVIGAAYFENGQRTVAYFDATDRAVGERFARDFPGLAATVENRDDAGAHYIVSVEGSDRPVQLYHFDVARGTETLVEDSAPWLADKHLAASRIVRAKGSDGLPIEAYLTLPLDVAGKAPLIVYSHGGPIGVRDAPEFDPSVQLFASLGYAVLQVNFRGSDGYGRAFREAGRHHYGSLIEDDIDAALQVALAQYPLDADRMCAVGASYGGYSALVSAIRWPKRFRCAVSIAGVSDQLLMFTASDAAWTEGRRDALERAIGNPATDAESMRAYAPLYRYEELTVPLMLAHGTEDERVDYEHSRRLVRMLNLAGRPPVMLSFAGEGHGAFEPENEIALWKAVAGFLRAHLDAPVVH